MRKLIATRRRKVVAVLAALGILIAGGSAAFAFILYHGSGTGTLHDTSPVGGLETTTVGLTISGGLDSGAETLLPGSTYNATPEAEDTSQGVYIQNTSNYEVSVDLVDATYVVTSDDPACPAGSFTFTPEAYGISSGGPSTAAASFNNGANMTTYPTNPTVGNPVDLSADSTIAVSGLETWQNLSSDQTSCLGSHLTLTVTIP
jgi:hypothetical protein